MFNFMMFAFSYFAPECCGDPACCASGCDHCAKK
jgi:hypothetical protein